MFYSEVNLVLQQHPFHLISGFEMFERVRHYLQNFKTIEQLGTCIEQTSYCEICVKDEFLMDIRYCNRPPALSFETPCGIKYICGSWFFQSLETSNIPFALNGSIFSLVFVEYFPVMKFARESSGVRQCVLPLFAFSWIIIILGRGNWRSSTSHVGIS